MIIKRQQDGIVQTVILKGRLDTITTPELEAELKNDLQDTQELVLELSELEYISSAGLRLLLSLHKQMAATDGRLVLNNVTDGVMDILKMTGFADFLTFEHNPVDSRLT